MDQTGEDHMKRSATEALLHARLYNPQQGLANNKRKQPTKSSSSSQLLGSGNKSSSGGVQFRNAAQTGGANPIGESSSMSMGIWALLWSDIFTFSRKLKMAKKSRSTHVKRHF